MQPLTQSCPKPLLKAGGKALLEHWLLKLEAAGISQIIINTAYLGQQIEDYLAARSSEIPILLSSEGEPLETGGALLHALPLLGSEPFLLVNGDVFCEFSIADFIAQAEMQLGAAFLLMVNNPSHHALGDFVLSDRGLLEIKGSRTGLTFSGISVISPALIAAYPRRRAHFGLREVFEDAIAQNRVRGAIFDGYWLDVGTPARLAELDRYLLEKQN
jgi:MurNAc alpha-1-phosphate uridylyltransferase